MKKTIVSIVLSTSFLFSAFASASEINLGDFTPHSQKEVKRLYDAYFKAYAKKGGWVYAYKVYESLALPFSPYYNSEKAEKFKTYFVYLYSKHGMVKDALQDIGFLEQVKKYQLSKLNKESETNLALLDF